MKKEARFIHSVISFGLLAIIMFLSVVVLQTDPQIPLILGCIIAGLIAMQLGYRWEEILESMLDGIHESLEAILILISIGVLVSTWVASGTVPTMIYYGLSIVTPQSFLVATFIVCSVVSMIVGAWGTVGSVGLAFMGIGQTIGVDVGIVAGAIVAGAYVGDKLSPFSDGTNLAASVSGANLFGMIRQMVGLIAVVYVVCAIGFTIIGLRMPSVDAAQIQSSVMPLQMAIAENYHVGILSLFPLVVMVICVVLKVPSLPAILIGAFVGAIQAIFMQGETVAQIIQYATTGYISQTGFTSLDELLSAGGLESMLRTISIIIIAMAYGGLMRGTSQMDALVAPIIKKVRSCASMIAVTVITCIGANILLPDQYLGIAVPGQMYGKEYEKRGMNKELLGNALGAGAAVTSALIPWNTCGMFIYTILGVQASQYGIYALFNWLLPVAMVLYGVAMNYRLVRKN